MTRGARTAEGVPAAVPTRRPLPATPVVRRWPWPAIAAGMLWTLPNTAVGLLLGAVGTLFGARARVRAADLVLVFHRWPWGPGGALTLGNVILHTGDDLDVACATYAHVAGHGAEPAVSLALHERAHVYQYMALGPLFLPAYLACGGVGVRNRFERAADRFAATGRGWWPWPAPPWRGQ